LIQVQTSLHDEQAVTVWNDFTPGKVLLNL